MGTGCLCCHKRAALRQPCPCANSRVSTPCPAGSCSARSRPAVCPSEVPWTCLSVLGSSAATWKKSSLLNTPLPTPVGHATLQKRPGLKRRPPQRAPRLQGPLLPNRPMAGSACPASACSDSGVVQKVNALQHNKLQAIGKFYQYNDFDSLPVEQLPELVHVQPELRGNLQRQLRAYLTLNSDGVRLEDLQHAHQRTIKVTGGVALYNPPALTCTLCACHNYYGTSSVFHNVAVSMSNGAVQYCQLRLLFYAKTKLAFVHWYKSAGRAPAPDSKSVYLKYDMVQPPPGMRLSAGTKIRRCGVIDVACILDVKQVLPEKATSAATDSL